jgi:hypothetical protein
VTFSTDVFHPLLTPLTTYTYTTGSLDTDTVSATDDERLPPGGFSLRHGFPQWFGRARRSEASSRDASAGTIGSLAGSATPVPAALSNGLPAANDVSIVKILDYIRSTFSEESVLDSLSLEAAANPGAYHAWRTYRAPALQVQDSPVPNSGSSASPQLEGNAALGPNRRPGEWNWEGVWQDRVRKAIKASLSEPVLFAAEDIVSSLRLTAKHASTNENRFVFGTPTRTPWRE